MPDAQVLVIDDSPTILKVVQLVLTKAGYAVRTALDGEAGVQAAREARPDVILLDFVMPKMNGYQVCRALADTDGLRDVPVVLMSAKGDQVGERFVKVMGIVDYITKPFSPEAITAVVGHTVAKYARGVAPSTGQRAEAGDEAAPLPPVPSTDPIAPVPTLFAAGFGAAPLDGVPDGLPSEEKTAPRSAIAVETRHENLERIREGVARAVSSDDLVGDELAEKIRTKLTDDVLGRIIDELAAMPTGALGQAASTESLAARIRSAPASGEGVVLEGDLAAVPLGEVLSLLDHQQQSGVLSVRTQTARVDLHFRHGKIELAEAEGLGEEFLLGRYVLELELMTRPAFDEFLAVRDPGRLLGEQLVERNLLGAADLHLALRRHSCERVYEVMRWRGGRFSFVRRRELAPLAESAALELSVDGILMEGFRRVDEWHLIERAIDDFDAVFLRNEAAVQQVERARLTREELAVLELVNGRNTVKEIVRESRMSSFDVSKMLFRLLSIKLVRRRVAPVAV